MEGVKMNAEFYIKNKVIETERLLLRAFKETDLNNFYEYAKVDGVGEMAGWPHHKNIEESKKILDRFIKNDIVFAIVYTIMAHSTKRAYKDNLRNKGPKPKEVIIHE